MFKKEKGKVKHGSLTANIFEEKKWLLNFLYIYCTQEQKMICNRGSVRDIVWWFKL